MGGEHYGPRDVCVGRSQEMGEAPASLGVRWWCGGGSRCSERPLAFWDAPPLLAAPRLGVPNGPPDVEDELIWEGEVPEL